MKLWHVYVGIAVVAFVATGSQALGYVDAGFVGGTIDFWDDALSTNDAARFLAFDVTMLAVAVFVLMWVESRKVGIGASWYVGYVLLSLLIGISTFVPLFLAHRERRLEALASSDSGA